MVPTMMEVPRPAFQISLLQIMLMRIRGSARENESHELGTVRLTPEAQREILGDTHTPANPNALHTTAASTNNTSISPV